MKNKLSGEHLQMPACSPLQMHSSSSTACNSTELNCSTDCSHEKIDEYARLDHYYQLVNRQIIQYQSLPHGLFPLKTAQCESNEGHVRDNVYCSLSIWTLALAYRHFDNNKGRSYELEQSAVKCMRGILFFYMRQAHHVEHFKSSQDASHSLQCKFDINTTDVIIDEDYPNMQMDVVSLYLLVLVQMISSGLFIIFTTDEVNFIQNLVYYIERTYRTADFGMWERGSRSHSGDRELNASSIGMTKAALESINGFNLFGSKGVSSSVIHVDPDAHNRNLSIFCTLLPRESNSKNTDASLLTVVGFPAFAIDDEQLRNDTRQTIITTLKGTHGLKRFQRDGYGTVIEDRMQKFYDRKDLQSFAGIESEWPIFYAYLALDALFHGDSDAGEYLTKLETLMVHSDNGKVLPKFYYVSKYDFEQELDEAGSANRKANLDNEENIFLWGQSMYIIANLLVEGLVSVEEFDCLRRSSYGHAKYISTLGDGRYSIFKQVESDPVVNVCLIAQNRNLQANLRTYGIETQTAKEIEPFVVCPPGELVKVYGELGKNKKLCLSGRPTRPIGALGTSKVYRILGRIVVTYPLLLEEKDFYMSLDMPLLIDNIKSDLLHMKKCWNMSGRPIIVLYVREHYFSGLHSSEMVDFMAQLKTGEVNGVTVKLGRLQTFVPTSCLEHLDFLKPDIGFSINTLTCDEEPAHLSPVGLKSVYHQVLYSDEEVDSNSEIFDQMLKADTQELTSVLCSTQQSIQQQMRILEVILKREGPAFSMGDDTSVTDYINKLYTKACYVHNWTVVRHGAALLGKLVDSLAPSITSMLVSGKQVSLGVFGHAEHLISEPLAPAEIKKILYERCMPVNASDAVLQQELVIYLAKIITTDPHIFHGMLKIRVGWIIEAMKNQLRVCDANADEEKFLGSIYSLYPNDVKQLLLAVLTGKGVLHGFNLAPRNMLEKRKVDGCLNRLPPSFYEKVWYILTRVSGGLKVMERYLPQQPIITEMTVDEADFKLRVEELLVGVSSPVYHQVIVELIMVVAAILERSRELEIEKTIDLNKLIHEAVTLYEKDQGPEKRDVALDSLDSGVMITYLARAVVSNILQESILPDANVEACKVL